MNDVLFNLLYAVIIAAVAVITRYVVPYFAGKIDQTKLSFLKDYIQKAIAYAESAITGTGKGSEKFDLVLKKVEEWMNGKNIPITEEQLKILIQGIFAECDGITVNTTK